MRFTPVGWICNGLCGAHKGFLKNYKIQIKNFHSTQSRIYDKYSVHQYNFIVLLIFKKEGLNILLIRRNRNVIPHRCIPIQVLCQYRKMCRSKTQTFENLTMMEKQVFYYRSMLPYPMSWVSVCCCVFRLTNQIKQNL